MPTPDSTDSHCIEEGSLVVLVGAPGSGKSSLAQRLFKPAEILSSDQFRDVLAGDESSAAADPSVFSLLQAVAEFRLAQGLTTVVDSVGTQPTRDWAIEVRRRTAVSLVAIVLDIPESVCLRHNARRSRQVSSDVITRYVEETREFRSRAPGQSFDQIIEVCSASDVRRLRVGRQPAERQLRGVAMPTLHVAVRA